MRAASEFEEDISDNDRKDIKTLIDVLIKSKDYYLRENGERIIKNIEKKEKEKVSRQLDSLLNYWRSN